MRGALLAVIVLAACGSDSSPSIDAPRAIDAAIDAKVVDAAPPDAMSLVQDVDCAGVTPVATVTAPGFAYSPSSVTINVNDVVEFQMPSSHDVQPNTTGSDPGIHVGFSETRCKKFTAAGTYGFHCGPHQFTGSITVN